MTEGVRRAWSSASFLVGGPQDSGHAAAVQPADQTRHAEGPARFRCPKAPSPTKLAAEAALVIAVLACAKNDAPCAEVPDQFVRSRSVQLANGSVVRSGVLGPDGSAIVILGSGGSALLLLGKDTVPRWISAQDDSVVGARWASPALVELYHSNGDVESVPTFAGERIVLRLRAPIVSTQAVAVGDRWLSAEPRRSTTSWHTILRLWDRGSGAFSDSLDLPGTYLLAAFADRAIAVSRRPPHTVQEMRVSRGRIQSSTIDTIQPTISRSGSERQWFPVAVAAWRDGYVVTIADLRSDLRQLWTRSKTRATPSVHELQAPLGFVAATRDGDTLLAAARIIGPALMWYRGTAVAGGCADMRTPDRR